MDSKMTQQPNIENIVSAFQTLTTTDLSQQQFEQQQQQQQQQFEQQTQQFKQQVQQFEQQTQQLEQQLQQFDQRFQQFLNYRMYIIFILQYKVLM
jgi:hypothetical protein